MKDLVRGSSVPSVGIELVAIAKELREPVTIDVPVLGKHINDRQRHQRVVRNFPRYGAKSSRVNQGLDETRFAKVLLPKGVSHREPLERYANSCHPVVVCLGHEVSSEATLSHSAKCCAGMLLFGVDSPNGMPPRALHVSGG